MIEKLKIKAIYDDFVSKVHLNEEQKRILNMMLKKDKIIKISLEIGVSERTIKYEIKKIKNLYNNYLQMEITKMISLIN
jgi:predicted transcriptional regulator